MTATDSVGGKDTHCIDVFPEEADYTFDSFPTGLKLSCSGVNFVTPFTLTAPVSSQRIISAVGSQTGMLFEGWSDSGSATHQITIGPANASLLATYQSTIIVQARGQTGEELIDLQIDEVTVATLAVSDTMMDDPYAINAAVTADQVRVVFTNDMYIPPDYDRGVFVDRIVVNRVEIETEHPRVLSTGTWDGTSDPGFKQSEVLGCGGYFQYGQVAMPLETFAPNQAWDGLQWPAEVGFDAGEFGAAQDISRLQNPVNAGDVNADGGVTAHDALLIINRLSNHNMQARIRLGTRIEVPIFMTPTVID